jgi:hypothetical protein
MKKFFSALLARDKIVEPDDSFFNIAAGATID